MLPCSYSSQKEERTDLLEEVLKKEEKMQEERVRRMMFDRVGALEDAENIQLNDEETPETRAVEDAL